MLWKNFGTEEKIVLEEIENQTYGKVGSENDEYDIKPRQMLRFSLKINFIVKMVIFQELNEFYWVFLFFEDHH